MAILEDTPAKPIADHAVNNTNSQCNNLLAAIEDNHGLNKFQLKNNTRNMFPSKELIMFQSKEITLII